MNRWTSPRAWLERLGFSLMILAGWMFYEAWKMYQGRVEGSSAKVASFVVIGALLMGVGMAGVRMRHRQ